MVLGAVYTPCITPTEQQHQYSAHDAVKAPMLKGLLLSQAKMPAIAWIIPLLKLEVEGTKLRLAQSAAGQAAAPASCSAHDIINCKLSRQSIVNLISWLGDSNGNMRPAWHSAWY